MANINSYSFRRSAAALISIGLVLTGVFGWPTVASYVMTSRRLARQELADSTPLSFHLERLHQMVTDLAPEVQRNRAALAEAEVDVEHLEKEIDERQSALDQSKSRILQLRSLLNSPDERLWIGGREYGRTAVESELATKLDAYNAAEETLDGRRGLLNARRDVAQAARAKVDGYERQLRELDIRTTEVDSQFQLLESRKGYQTLAFDRSKLAEAQRLAADLRRKIDVANKIVDAEGVAQNGIALGGPVRRSVASEVDEKFGAHGAPRDGGAAH